jgi:acetylornithine deacetylase/succinyl-diaminopimelate desuccinylase-like protein
VPNPINVLCELIASLKDENNHITIPGFYDQVLEISSEERKEMAKAPFELDKFKKELGLSDILGESGYTTTERTSIRPTLDVNGIWGGYTGEGAKTVIASKAYAKISMRLVPNQHPDIITKLFSDHFKKIAPDSVQVEVRPHHGGEPSVLDTHSKGYHAAVKAFEETWDQTPVPKREGGSIPIVALFKQELGLDTVLLGFGLDTDAIHSPNEHYGVFNYLKGIETICSFHHQFAEISKK